MLEIFQWVFLIAIIWAFAYYAMPLIIWAPIFACVLGLLSFYGSISSIAISIIWIIFLTITLFYATPPLRKKFFTTPILNYLRRALPKMSDTEREAIDAGDVWWDAELFSGKPNWKNFLNEPAPSLTAEEQDFLDNQVEKLCSMLDDWKIVHELHDLPQEVWQFIKKERFWGMIIPKSYGGLGFSALAHSTVIIKIATRSISAGVTVMVPNSLGPGELLIKYGTEEQKQHYLPKLAKGDEIPCFGLTALEAGSDATAMQDTGIVCKGKHNDKEVLGIKLTWHKRYITLAPVATVLGLAFKLYDPQHLLGEKENIGITLALIPTSHSGVEIGKRHNPLGMAFMNGPTSGKDVFIPLEWIIGGEKMAGQGWRMLMECLSVGRSISIPALSTGLGKFAYRNTSAYARLRRQFNSSIGQFEGVEEILARIGGFTYLLEATRVMTANAVDKGLSPTVISAIAKYHMSEMSRQLVNDMMDIHGGRAIQLGPRNYIAHVYQSIPISITVEGANILTRNLIIFGQGALRCHPYLHNEINIVNDSDGLNAFDKLLRSHIAFYSRNKARTSIFALSAGWLAPTPVSGPTAKYFKQINRMSSTLAWVTDIAMMFLGGSLKRRERLSARLGDVLSYLYLASATLKYFAGQKESTEDRIYVDWCLQYCLHQIQNAFYDFFSNFPHRWLGRILRITIFPYGRCYPPPSDKLCHEIAEHMQKPSAFRDRITQHSYYGKQQNDPTGRIEAAFATMMAAEPLYKKLYALKSDEKDFTSKLNQAEKDGSLTSDECKQLREAEQLRLDALQVDDF